MQRIFMQMAFLLALFAATLPSPAQNPASTNPNATKNDEIAKTIVALEYKWAEAQKIGNAEAVAPLLAESFVNTDVDAATSGKKILLSNLKGGKWEDNEISDVEARSTVPRRLRQAHGRAKAWTGMERRSTVASAGRTLGSRWMASGYV